MLTRFQNRPHLHEDQQIIVNDDKFSTVSNKCISVHAVPQDRPGPAADRSPGAILRTRRLQEASCKAFHRAAKPQQGIHRAAAVPGSSIRMPRCHQLPCPLLQVHDRIKAAHTNVLKASAWFA